MMRFAFFLLAATLVVASVTLWWRPDAPPQADVAADALASPPPEAVEMAAVPTGSTGSAPATPPAAVSPPPVSVPPVAPPEAGGAGSPAPPPADVVATPRLEEEAAELVAPRPAFSDEPPADAWIEASVAEEPSDAEPEATPPPPVDVDRSGDLVRRMLGLYGAMRE